MESLALFRLSNGWRIGFWTDTWIGVSSLNVQFPKLFRIALLHEGSVAAHWDSSTLSWSLVFRRLMKEEEI